MEGGKEDGEREREGQKEGAKPRYKPRIMSLRERGTGLATSDSEPRHTATGTASIDRSSALLPASMQR